MRKNVKLSAYPNPQKKRLRKTLKQSLTDYFSYMKNLFVILGNQLFHPKLLKEKGCTDVFMAEDFGLCTYVKHHKLKIYFFLCSMREYADELRTTGINVHYFKLSERDENQTYAELLCSFLNEKKVAKLNLFEIEDKSFELPLLEVLTNAGASYSIFDSPMFLFSRKDFSDFHKLSLIHI